MHHDNHVSCQRVRRELSNFLDDDIGRPLREAIDQHLRTCRHCSTLHDSTRNVLALFRDERFLEVPAGFSERLHAFLTARMRE